MSHLKLWFYVNSLINVSILISATTNNQVPLNAVQPDALQASVTALNTHIQREFMNHNIRGLVEFHPDDLVGAKRTIQHNVPPVYTLTFKSKTIIRCAIDLPRDQFDDNMCETICGLRVSQLAGVQVLHNTIKCNERKVDMGSAIGQKPVFDFNNLNTCQDIRRAVSILHGKLYDYCGGSL